MEVARYLGAGISGPWIPTEFDNMSQRKVSTLLGLIARGPSHGSTVKNIAKRIAKDGPDAVLELRQMAQFAERFRVSGADEKESAVAPSPKQVELNPPATIVSPGINPLVSDSAPEQRSPKDLI